ncbi:MAG TPA: SagB/ThcOx family dehydrogenase [Candidatus Paceibacterota bacterium]|nr:SagB/ThcOx family dehydrogenase [Candidatus Paceibacterota bacterium]
MFKWLAQFFHDDAEKEFFDNPISENVNDWPAAWKRISYKEYVRMPTIPLESVSLLTNPLEEALHKRHSRRRFQKEPVDAQKLSTLLYYSAGLKDSKKNLWGDSSRFYPSPGALYALEVYIAIFSETRNIAPGLYHYNVKNHALEFLAGKEEMRRVQNFIYPSWAQNAYAAIIMTAVWTRILQKYHNKGYSMALMEAGHLSQNIQLVAATLDLAACPIAAFNSKGIEKMLDLTTRNDESVLLVTMLGNPKQ